MSKFKILALLRGANFSAHLGVRTGDSNLGIPPISEFELDDFALQGNKTMILRALHTTLPYDNALLYTVIRILYRCVTVLRSRR